MHHNSMREMRKFIQQFLDVNKKIKILDVGSLNVHEKKPDYSYRRYFVDDSNDNSNWEYVGMDIIAGNNVDIVSNDLYHYPFEDNSFDVVISGSTMEHVEDIYAWVKELTRITNDLIFILVPNSAREHKHPVDCWRVFPDGMRFLLEKICGLEVLKCGISGNDTIGIAKKIIK